ncbi:DUF6461 domain-containing protein [Streptosporangium canum]|uniref:DUF6461 domain-containing protein n=1 Tax=Streptosporangium canum TaxID=324952 RepID=UPI0036C21E53
MIAPPDDYSRFPSEHLPDLGGAYCFTYVRGLTPEELVIRLGVRIEDCSHMTLDELTETAYSSYDGKNMFFGAVAVGDWVLLVEANGGLGVTEEIIVPLSAGTRLVSHFYLDIKDMDYFHWIKNGKIQPEFPHQEGYSEEMPDELAQTMEWIDSLYPPHTYPNEGPAFLLAERLTGITMTPQLLGEATYLCGVVPNSR